MPKRVKDDYADLIYKIEPAPPRDIKAELQKIESFRRRNTFTCTKMVARVSRQYCSERQTPKAAYRSAYAPRYKEDPFQAYCLSGKCAEGLACLRDLELEKEQWATETNSPAIPATTIKRSRKSRRGSSLGSRKLSNPRK